MFEFEAYKVFKTKEFTFVNDCFKDEYNKEIRHYKQTLINQKIQHSNRQLLRLWEIWLCMKWNIIPIIIWHKYTIS